MRVTCRIVFAYAVSVLSSPTSTYACVCVCICAVRWYFYPVHGPSRRHKRDKQSAKYWWGWRRGTIIARTIKITGLPTRPGRNVFYRTAKFLWALLHTQVTPKTNPARMCFHSSRQRTRVKEKNYSGRQVNRKNNTLYFVYDASVWPKMLVFRIFHYPRQPDDPKYYIILHSVYDRRTSLFSDECWKIRVYWGGGASDLEMSWLVTSLW